MRCTDNRGCSEPILIYQVLKKSEKGYILFERNKNIANILKRQTVLVEWLLRHYIITTVGAIYVIKEVYKTSKISSVHHATWARSRGWERNGVFTVTEHDALIIKGYGHVSDTKGELAKIAVIYKVENTDCVSSAQFSFSGRIQMQNLYALISINIKC